MSSSEWNVTISCMREQLKNKTFITSLRCDVETRSSFSLSLSFPFRTHSQIFFTARFERGIKNSNICVKHSRMKENTDFSSAWKSWRRDGGLVYGFSLSSGACNRKGSRVSIQKGFRKVHLTTTSEKYISYTVFYWRKL